MKVKNRSVYVRFSEDDYKIIDQIAKKKKTWKGTWIREVIIKELVKIREKKSHESNVRERARC